MGEPKIDYFAMVANTGSAPNSKFSQLGGMERAQIAAQITKQVKETCMKNDRLAQILAESQDEEIKEKIRMLSPERRAKLNFLINSGVVSDEFLR